MKKFSDFAQEEIAFTGDKVPLEKLLNVPIIVTNYRLNESKYKKGNSDKCVTVQFYYHNDHKQFVFFSGSSVLINQCEKYKDEMPFEVKIQKVNRYYTFS
ncbi:MAG: hypothetical protein ACOC2F_03200 [Bacteroidota bacterium]